jgi:hypothetical protein
MIKIDCQRFLIGGQRFVEVLQVALIESDVVPGVGVARVGWTTFCKAANARW